MPGSSHRQHARRHSRIGRGRSDREGRARGRRIAALLLGTVVALGSQQSAAGAHSPAPCVNAGLRPTASNLAAVNAATVCLIDGIRRADGLRPLRPSRPLLQVAAAQSTEMVLGDYFGDDSRSGQTPLQRIVATGYPRRSAGISTAQNIGWGTGSQATPGAIIAAWMASPPHRHIMLTAGFRDVGVGAAPAAPAALSGGQSGATYTAEFGARLR